jgi:hypothetical protein
MLAARGGPLRIRFKCKPGTDDKQRRREFEAICTLVQAWGGCVFIAEELSQVTTPGWAPAAWRDMTTGGRHEDVHIIGIAQNPALIDKTFLSNCTLIHVGPLREARHRQAVARSIDVPVESITALVQFQWVERDHNTRQLRQGWSYPPGGAPTATVPTPRRRGAAASSQQAVSGGAMATSETRRRGPPEPTRSK